MSGSEHTTDEVWAILADEVVPRLARVEDIVSSAGLNGHSEILKTILDRAASQTDRAEAWSTVRADLKHRLRWLSYLAAPKNWLRMFFTAAIGGLAWQLVSRFLNVPWPHFGH